jgi:hypothetical protein
LDELAVTVSVPVPPIVKLSEGSVCPTATVSSLSPESVGTIATAVVAWADRNGEVFATFAASVITVPAAVFDGTPNVRLADTIPPFAARDPASQLTELTAPDDDDGVHEL